MLRSFCSALHRRSWTHQGEGSAGRARQHGAPGRSRRQPTRPLRLEPLESRTLLSFDPAGVGQAAPSAPSLLANAASLDAGALTEATANGRIAIGDVVSGSIGAKGEIDKYRFWARQGDAVSISLSDFTGDAWGRATLYSSATGTAVGTIYDGSKGEFTLPDTGQYVILVHDWRLTATGDYGVALEGINPPSLDAVPINSGVAKQGRIDQVGEMDAYQFSGAAGQKVVVALSDFTGDAWGRATLYSSSKGTVLGTVYDASQREFTLPETGDYVILVYDWRLTATGEYGLTLSAGSSLLAASVVESDFGVLTPNGGDKSPRGAAVDLLLAMDQMPV